MSSTTTAKNSTGRRRAKAFSETTIFRCYKCVNSDYNANYTDISYSIDFTVKTVGDKTRRSLECDSNVKQDASNICECDKRFAENIAKEAQSCKKGAPDDEKFGSRCIDETYRYTNFHYQPDVIKF